jgi:hypothetical protein
MDYNGLLGFAWLINSVHAERDRSTQPTGSATAQSGAYLINTEMPAILRANPTRAKMPKDIPTR